MHNSVKNLIYIEELIKSKAKQDQLAKIIAVSKTFPIENVFTSNRARALALWRK